MSSGPAPGAHLGPYRIDRLLGRGGMGVVYLAEHIHLERKVALKVLAPDLAGDGEFRQRFLRESQMAARVEHPNIIPVYDAGEADDLLYISMRYVDGMDLKTLITERAPLGVDYAVALIGQVAGALDAAHKHGLVHRDVKPGNILIDPDGSRFGHVYLTDFGLTKMANSHSSVTKTGMFLGSIDYAAPEQWEGRDLDGRTDIYALACVAFECLTSEVPYRRETPLSAMHAHLMEPPPRASSHRSELEGPIDSAIQRAMSKAAGERPATCKSFVDEMRGSPASPGVSSTTASDRTRVTPPVEPAPAAGMVFGQPATAPPGPVLSSGTSSDLMPTGVMEANVGSTSVDPLAGPGRRSLPPFLIGFAAVVLISAIAAAAVFLINPGEEPAAEEGATNGGPVGGGDDGGSTKKDSPGGSGGSAAPIAPADLRIVYKSEDAGLENLYVMDGRGRGVTSITATPGAAETDPAWSPDATEIAFESDAAGNHDLYVVSAEGGSTSARNITVTSSDESNPAWSPDGERLAYNSGGGAVADIFSIPADGGSATNLTNTAVDESDPNWSPDGTTLVFESGPAGARDIFMVDASGSTPVPLVSTAGDDIDPEWSPDGTKVAFSSDGDIFTANSDGSSLKSVSALSSIDTDPTWSPDGRHIAFEADEGGPNIYLVSANGGEATPLTSSGSTGDPAFAPK